MNWRDRIAATLMGRPPPSPYANFRRQDADMLDYRSLPVDAPMPPPQLPPTDFGLFISPLARDAGSDALDLEEVRQQRRMAGS